MLIRPRRLRRNSVLRNMVQETKVSVKSLILPVFVVEGENIYEPIEALEGHYYYSYDTIYKIIDEATAVGIQSFLLFGIPKEKDIYGSEAYGEDSVIQKTIKYLKEKYSEIQIITDVCMCEYTSHGHCGILKGESVDNDATLEYLARIAVSHAKAGADMVAPSDMMDGRVGVIRKALDDNGFAEIPIMSYSAKYASSFYGPFRTVAKSAPSFGDRKTYQMDYHNGREAIKEVQLDIEEGADIVMVKPALSYLDIIKSVSENVNCPVCAYSVSGEYAMAKAAAKAGLVNEHGVMCETTISIFRAGADILITYYAIDIAKAILKGEL